MFLLFLFVLLLFVTVVLAIVLLFFVLFFYKDSNMISIGIIEFRYYVVIIILVNLGKP